MTRSIGQTQPTMGRPLVLMDTAFGGMPDVKWGERTLPNTPLVDVIASLVNRHPGFKSQPESAA